MRRCHLTVRERGGGDQARVSRSRPGARVRLWPPLPREVLAGRGGGPPTSLHRSWCR